MVTANKRCQGFGFMMNSHHAPVGPLIPKTYALTVLQGTLDKSMQKTAYIMSGREKCVSAQLLPAVPGSSSTPGLLQNSPPKALSASLMAVVTTQAEFTIGITSSTPSLGFRNNSCNRPLTE